MLEQIKIQLESSIKKGDFKLTNNLTFIARLETPSEKKYRIAVLKINDEENNLEVEYSSESDSLRNLAIELYRYVSIKTRGYGRIFFEKRGISRELQDEYEYIYGNQ